MRLLFTFLVSFTLCAQGEFISVYDAAKKLNVGVSWDPLSEEIIFSKNNQVISCKVGEDFIIFNRTEIKFATAPRVVDSVTLISMDTVGVIEAFLKDSFASTPYRIGAILIDPGHGGKDPGSIGSYVQGGKTIPVREKDVALKVSLDLYNRLKQKYPDKQILLTRNGDTYPSLEDRVKKANSVKLEANEAIIYISIHANASLNKKASGFEVWYLTSDYRREVVDSSAGAKEILPILNSMMEEEFTMESILIAKSILNGMDAQIGKQSKNRGIKEESWFVVRNAKMPSVLVELGFVTNPTEAKLLNESQYLKKCATGIYNGLVSFIRHFEDFGGYSGT